MRKLMSYSINSKGETHEHVHEFRTPQEKGLSNRWQQVVPQFTPHDNCIGFGYVCCLCRIRRQPSNCCCTTRSGCALQQCSRNAICQALAGGAEQGNSAVF